MTAQDYGIVWLNGQQIYFREYRNIKSHKGIKRVAIIIRNKEYKLSVDAVKRWPKP